MSGKRQRQVRQVSSEGKFIKKALLELGMNQKDFCRKYDIPENRLSDIIHTDGSSRRMIPYRIRIYKLLTKLLKEAAG